VKAEGFRNFRRILTGELPHGIHFDTERMAEGFPVPGRDIVYRSYPHLAESPIKSIMCTVGCPFACSYCYAPHYNKLYGGFRLNVRPVDEIIDEAVRIRDNWPLKLIYMQDDIFGYDMGWLREFARKWRERVGVPIHGQIRLELTNKEERLDLFLEAGFTGLTLAIESGNDFLRRFVLFRGMSDELIVDGIRKIQSRGLALRTEQILAVPFSDIRTDIETLRLNTVLRPEMAWTSILVPYGGTNMGRIVSQLGFYAGNNDDIQDTFFERSVLQHVCGGPLTIESVVRGIAKKVGDQPLLGMYACRSGAYGDVFIDTKTSGLATLGDPVPACTLEYLSDEANNRYRDQTVILQRLFDWFSKLPQGFVLASKFVELEKPAWTWKKLGELTREHLESCGYRDKIDNWSRKLSAAMGRANPPELPAGIRDNPFYFVFLPSGAKLAGRFLEEGVFALDSEEMFRRIGRITRHHLYDHSLYRVIDADPPIAKSA
jgi:hypothetical protein